MSETLTREDIETLRARLVQYQVIAGKSGDRAKADPMTDVLRYQINALCELALRALDRPGYVWVPVEEWNQFIQDYQRYSDGDQKMDWNTFRLSLAVMVEAAMLAAREAK